MQVDLHGVHPGTHHVLVDSEGLRLIQALGRNPFTTPAGAVRIVMAPCPCQYQDAPGVPVSLIGFLT